MKIEIRNKKSAYAIEKLWLEAFCLNVKKKTGKYMPYAFKWENYSYGIESALKGVKAEQAYNEQLQEDYYLFNESLSEVWECDSEPFPCKLSGNDDWYVFPKTCAWSMIFTHEGSKFFVKR